MEPFNSRSIFFLQTREPDGFNTQYFLCKNKHLSNLYGLKLCQRYAIHF